MPTSTASDDFLDRELALSRDNEEEFHELENLDSAPDDSASNDSAQNSAQDSAGSYEEWNGIDDDQDEWNSIKNNDDEDDSRRLLQPPD